MPMKQVVAVAAFACLFALPVLAQAQAQAHAPAQAPAAQAAPATPPAQPLSATLKSMWDGLKLNLVQSAEKMPEGDFSFQPTKDVRTFGQMIAHVANSSFSYCARGKGEDNPNKEDFEKTKTTKADLVKALNDAVAYCDGVYGGMTDASAMELVKAGQNLVPRARYLITNISHDNEHYGNLVTYMRLKGLVPPSTERAQQMRK
jgi:uncharacterized damage-inducible protein DinB